ncbi:hypothetical protein D3C87_1749350 [compost metagenome]
MWSYICRDLRFKITGKMKLYRQLSSQCLSCYFQNQVQPFGPSATAGIVYLYSIAGRMDSILLRYGYRILYLCDATVIQRRNTQLTIIFNMLVNNQLCNYCPLIYNRNIREGNPAETLFCIMDQFSLQYALANMRK